MNKLDQLRSDIDGIDEQLAELFCRRMETARQIAAYKQANGLPILDAQREADVLSRRSAMVKDGSLLPHYLAFQQGLMDLSKTYQQSLLGGTPKLSLSEKLGYDIVLERGCLARAKDDLSLDRCVLIVTDDGVPPQYVDVVMSQCRNAFAIRVPQGEASKSPEMLFSLLRQMQERGMTRNDCVVAVGGGMVGDLAGFAASIYMRGIDFYNIPTTLLSQVDSSIGGKTAIDLDGVKNMVGTFYRPQTVLIDPDVLSTLPRRELAAGMAEVVKMALTCDEDLFTWFEQEDPFQHLNTVIAHSLPIKASIVVADETERGLRRVLNFGHTIGHAIEATHPHLLHGECVALGMLPMCSPEVRRRLIPVLQKIDLPITCAIDRQAIERVIWHDKKADSDGFTVTEVTDLGHFTMKHMGVDELVGRLNIIEKGVEAP